ncbi:MAG: hypothetical protein IJP68_05935 [Selenomonadaceae bacterium]|nr:hypothetical protein [Selenomonadaceae bacterium]
MKTPLRALDFDSSFCYQVAEGLNCSVDQLRSLFRSHQDEFQEGVHFFNVTGNDLHTLKKDMRNRHADSYFTHTFAKGSGKISSDATHFALSFGKGAKCLKLWTKQGVARLSKLIDTPQAWELFTALEKCYFNSAPAAPVETPRDEEPVKKVRRAPVPELAVVYAVLLSNMLVKIGYTRDLTARMKDLQKETKADVLKWAASAAVLA